MKIGLFGFPQTGKTTLFNTLTGASAAVGATGRPETHVGVARVPDERLDRLSAMFRPKKTTHATIEYIDPIGVEKGEARKSDSFLQELKQAEALAHVVRGFENDSVPHSQGTIDPRRDVETMETELILADHTLAVRRAERLEQSIRKSGREEDRRELELIRRCIDALERETPLREIPFTDEDSRRLRGFAFLSAKPLLIVLNAGEKDAGRLESALAERGLTRFAGKKEMAVCAASAQIEMEIARLEPPDARAFMDELGLGEPALDRIIRSSYALLGLVSFFTVGEDECRAWTIRDGTRALQAAGTIHSDIERGFIRAEVVEWKALLEAGSLAAARERGKLGLEGKDYRVRDGDVVHFRFNI
ncbi:MAG: redox-regulated ATPase YchF [Acidobacteria bacterium]|nr:MAG: redox-regulated ATPase YchF [Acidobacteriota bacterium]